MAAMLSAELGNADKVSHFVAETEAMGIKVTGPDVNESRENFTPVIAAQNAKSMGLQPGSSIQALVLGASRASANWPPSASSRSARRTGPYLIVRQFLVSRVDGKAINRRVLEHLVKTGAFDFSGEPRKILFDQLDAAMSTVAASARDKAAGQHSFLRACSLPTRLHGSRKPRMVQPRDFSAIERPTFEKELLGFYISGHPLDAYAGVAKALDTFGVEELMLQPGRTEFRLCGVASGIAKKLSKKDNRPWAAFTLATRKASIALNMFADAYAEFNASLTENAVVLVAGNVIVGADGARINVKECYPLAGVAASLVRKVTWLLDPMHASTPAFIRELREIVTSQSGDTRLELAFVFPDRAAPVAEVSSALSWKLNSDGLQRLRAHPAVVGVQFETKRLELKQDRRWGRK